jgi:effector-binding domain-containing protein
MKKAWALWFPLGLIALLGLLWFGAQSSSEAYESNYPKTPVGVVEIKCLPAASVMQAEGTGTSFKEADKPFFTLFKELKANQMAMTVPVEIDAPTNRLRFFVPSKDVARISHPVSSQVQLVKMPERTVLSIGQRGGYSQKRFEDGTHKLEQWLNQHPEWQAAGPAYAVFWNGPYTPGFLKRAEVHLPVTPKS